MLCFIRTCPSRREDKQYSRSVTVPLRRPTADTAAMVQVTVHGAEAIFRPGFNYAKAGVMLINLQDASVEQQELALDEGPRDRSSLMEHGSAQRTIRAGIDCAGQYEAIERAVDLDDEAVAEDAGVHDAVGGCAAGFGFGLTGNSQSRLCSGCCRRWHSFERSLTSRKQSFMVT